LGKEFNHPCPWGEEGGTKGGRGEEEENWVRIKNPHFQARLDNRRGENHSTQSSAIVCGRQSEKEENPKGAAWKTSRD